MYYSIQRIKHRMAHALLTTSSKSLSQFLVYVGVFLKNRKNSVFRSLSSIHLEQIFYSRALCDGPTQNHPSYSSAESDSSKTVSALSGTVAFNNVGGGCVIAPAADYIMPLIVAASGYFDPIHPGHLEYLERSKQLVGPEGKLYVIVNNDNQVQFDVLRWCSSSRPCCCP